MKSFVEVTNELTELYVAKDNDYVDSFNDLLYEFGLITVVIRLQDKMNRLKTIAKSGGEYSVKDETTRDILTDLANYSIMALMRL